MLNELITKYERLYIKHGAEEHEIILYALKLTKAEQEERLIALPFKVGDVVYSVEGGKVYKDKVHEIKLSVTGILFNLDFKSRVSVWIPMEMVGKTVFLTKEEAEKTLEGSKSGSCKDK